MTKKGIELISAVLEGIIPVLGYFLWDWNIYFVLVFYLFDYLVNQVLFSLKTHKVLYKPGYFKGKDTSLRSNFLKIFLLQLMVAGLVLSLFGFATLEISSTTIKDFSLLDQSSDFFWYRELGIPQGFLLIPLFILMGYAFYKMKFLMPRLYIVLEFNKFNRQFFMGQALLTGFIGLCIGINHFFVLPQYFYVVLVAAVKLVFDAFIYDKLYR